MSFDIFAKDFASKTFDKVGDSAERLGRRLDSVGKGASSVGGHFKTLSTNVGSVGVNVASSAVKLGAAAGAMASLASSAGGLVAALAPAGGIVAALPGALALAQGAMLTLKVATIGVQEAFSAALGDDAKKFEESLKGLSPAAQSTARELRALKPELDGIKNAVQDSLFAPLQGQLTALAAALSGPVREGMSGVASEFGQAGVQVAQFARSAESVSAVQSIFASLRESVAGLRPAIEPVLAGFRDLAVVGASFSAGLTPGIADAAARFGEFLSRAAESGQALQWMTNAVSVFKELGSIAKDVGGILGGLFDAMRASGNGALGVIGQLLEGLNQFVNSAQGQQILVTIFQSLSQVGAAFLPVITAIAAGIATLAPVVAQLATTVGPILAQVVGAIAPALAALAPGIIAVIGGIGQAVRALAPALAPLGAAIGSAFAALRPLIAAIGPAIVALLPGIQAFALAFAQGFAALAPALAPIGAAIGSVLQALAPLLPAVGQLAALIATSLAAGVQAILPSLQMLVSAFSQGLQALSPIVPLLVSLGATLINSLVPAFAPLLPQIASLVTQLAQGLIPAVTPLIPIIAQVAGQLGQFLVSALGLLLTAITPVLPILSELAQSVGKALLQALVDITPSLLAIIEAFLGLIPVIAPILPLLAELAEALLPVVAEHIEVLAPLVVELVNASIQLVAALMPLLPIIVDLALKLMPTKDQMTYLAQVITEDVIPAVRDITNTVVPMVKDVVAGFQWLYDKLIGHSIIPDLINGITSWVSGLPAKFAEWFGNAKDSAINKFGELLDWARGLPGAILGAIGNVGSVLGNVGRDMIVGVWNGMSAQFDWFKDRVYNFFNAIMPQWVKDALGIRSPSKLFAELGKQLPAGMAAGIDSAAGLVESAAERLARSATIGAVPVGVSPVTPVGAGGGIFGAAAAPTLVFNFSGRPLIGEDEIFRLVQEAIEQASRRGFPLGVIGGTT